jgi:hypothetical protein
LSDVTERVLGHFGQRGWEILSHPSVIRPVALWSPTDKRHPRWRFLWDEGRGYGFHNLSLLFVEKSAPVKVEPSLPNGSALNEIL